MIIGSSYVYLACPRTASNTTAQWLRRHYGGRDLPVGYKAGPVGCRMQHHSTEVPDEHCGKFIWGVARNPYDRMLSLWAHLRHAHSPVVDGIETPAGMVRRLLRDGYPAGQPVSTFCDWAPLVDRVLKYEDLRDAAQSLPFYGDYPFPETVVNHQPRGRFEDEMTPEFIAAVNEHCAADFERFGYEKS